MFAPFITTFDNLSIASVCTSLEGGSLQASGQAKPCKRNLAGGALQASGQAKPCRRNLAGGALQASGQAKPCQRSLRRRIGSRQHAFPMHRQRDAQAGPVLRHRELCKVAGSVHQCLQPTVSEASGIAAILSGAFCLMDVRDPTNALPFVQLCVIEPPRTPTRAATPPRCGSPAWKKTNAKNV